jgi:menaquinone-specific isochorismate synthase
MRTALAFLQTGADATACVAAPLTPVATPRAGLPAFFAPDFSMTLGEPWWLEADGSAVATLTRAEWQRRFPAGVVRPTIPEWGAPDEGRFVDGFRTLMARLDAGSLRKGVPITVMKAPVDPDDAPALFAQVISHVPELPANLFAYGFYRPASETGTGSPEFLVGATPELLFELHGDRRLSTMAVAGTRRAGGRTARLDASPKDRVEHQSVVEDLLSQLATWGRPTASRTEVRSFGQLEHLAVDIQLEANATLDFEAVARRLHPTPALGVYPRGEAGDAWLSAIDPRGERKRFGAPFGLRWPSGAGRCLVAIRNLQYRDGQLEIWAGCGVVSQSRYGDEWQEVLDKMHAVRALWGL